MAEPAFNDDVTPPTNASAPPVDTGSAPPPGPVTPIASAPPAAPTSDTPAEPRVFPDDWREQLAGGDEKLLKELSRYSSPKSLVQSWKEARTKLSSGQYKTPMPEGATDEEMAAWRAENGIPNAPTDYKIELGDGMVLGDEDQPLVQSFLEEAFGQNLPEQAVNAALRAYYKFNDRVQEQQYEADTQFHEESLRELRQDWGPEMSTNLNAIKTLVGEHADYLWQCRGPDGRILGDNPAILRLLADTARKVFPLPTLIPGGGPTNIETVDSEINNLKKMMGNPASDYWKGPKSAQLQARYLQLLEARERMG